MVLAFLAQDLLHLMQPTKEAAGQMQKPTAGALQSLKRIGRYLKGRPRCVQVFHCQTEVKDSLFKAESDHACCKETRLSTSCTLLLRGKHLLRCSSTTQTIQGLSSGESEFMALVRGASVGLGAKSMASDFGMIFGLNVDTDSSAAKGVGLRRGVGKIRHLHLPLLWLQKRVSPKAIRVFKMPGTENEADIGTKALNGEASDQILGRLLFKFERGQSQVALRAAISAVPLIFNPDEYYYDDAPR